MSKATLSLPADYADWLTSLKARIQGARQRALLSANAEQIRLYHDLGCDILERQSREKWGAKVIDHLSADLRAAQACPDRRFVPQSAAPAADLIGQQTAASLVTRP